MEGKTSQRTYCDNTFEENDRFYNVCVCEFMMLECVKGLNAD